MNKTFLTLIIIAASLNSVLAQEVLRKEVAVAIALENNFDIKLAQYDVDAASNNASIKNSGYLPSISGNGSASYSINTLIRPSESGEGKTTTSGIENRNYVASLDLEYTLFDGFTRKYMYQRLKEQYKLSALQARAVIESSLIEIFSSYYEVARRTQDVETLKEALAISKLRYRRAGYAYDYGQGSKLDLLNAEVDINTDSINYINAIQVLANAKRDLNLLLGRAIATEFVVDTIVSFSSFDAFDVLETQALNNNVMLNQANTSIAVNQYALSGNRSGYVPKVILNGAYNWNKSRNGLNPLFGNQTAYGPLVQASLRWNIFDGGKTDISLQNAKIALMKEEESRQQRRLMVKRDIANSYNIYETSKFNMQAQRNNLTTNRRNFDRTQEQFRIGQATSIVFRQAQINLLNAKIAYNQAKYDAKNAELRLLQLTGRLTEKGTVY